MNMRVSDSDILINNSRELSAEEIDQVVGAVNWVGVGRVLGTAVRLGAVGGGVGVVAAAGVVGGALLIDYALDGKLDLID